jgi:DNA-binding NtrC family response regulator
VASLRERKDDIPILFRKFCVDFATRYKSQPIQLKADARNMLMNYRWPGNIRELKNIAEQISVLAPHQEITAEELSYFLPNHSTEQLPALSGHNPSSQTDFNNERDILYKLFFDMKKDVNDLKKMFFEIVKNPSLGQSYMEQMEPNDQQLMPFSAEPNPALPGSKSILISNNNEKKMEIIAVEESLNLADHEKEYIVKALKKHKGKRRDAASELGISERTLYRKIKEYDIDE